MPAYLFVHFREKTTPDGEQVYFGISKDGFHWEAVNDGKPVLWCFYVDKGARDFTIIHSKHNQKYYIWGTDLSLSYGMRTKYNGSWENISRKGSDSFSVWESEDLVNWTEQSLVKLGNENFGCLWAPDIIYDKVKDDYVLHWSSAHSHNDFSSKSIFYSRTKDFKTFTEPEELYRKTEKDYSGVIDSAMYEEDGKYYMFLKSEGNPAKIILVKSDNITGPFERLHAFDTSMENLESAMYEAPTAVKLENGSWCLFLDYYGTTAKGQGYVPFIAENLAHGKFIRSDQKFDFPYGYKHGTILSIAEEDYERVKKHKWE